MAAIANIVILAGLILFILAVIGLLRGTAPFFKLKSRGLYGVSLVGGFVLIVIGGLLIPKNDVILSVTPTNAIVKVDGMAYKGGQTKLKLVVNAKYTVEASAAGYKPQKLEWDTGKQLNLSVRLIKKTAVDLAAERAVLEQQKRDAAAEVKRQQAEAAAARVAEARQARELNDGEFVVQCEELVTSQLKAPHTAQFPGILEKADGVITYKNGNKDWSGWVDSQNAFGATVRTEFLCEYDNENGSVSTILR